MSAWRVQAARVTVFPLLASGTAPRSALDLYKAVWGKEPDNFQSQSAPIPTSQAQGVVGTIGRICQSQPIRADFTFMPTTGADATVLPLIEDTELLSTEMAALIGSISKAFQKAPLNRVAAFLQVGQETTNYSDANKALSGAMWEDKKVSLSDEEEFLLQINPTRSDSKDPTLKLNFITKWAVERVQLMTFFNQVSAGNPGMANAPVVIEKIVPSIALDNSNMPLQKPFADSEITRVLLELFREMPSQLKRCNISIKGF
jgi:hypothetical protein